LPCIRLGGSWVMLERDVALIGRIASRARRPRTSAPTRVAAPSHVLAAVFDDGAAAGLAAEALEDRLRGAAEEITTAPLGVPSLPALSLTLLAGRIAGASALDARRILAAFGGRIVADVEEIRAAPVPAGDESDSEAGAGAGPLEATAPEPSAGLIG
ncbi:MAG TPA: hypothetical protein VH723_06860, partial [Candidatus Limnocylindrales bacterium]